ncbi:MAG: TIGR02594 family protein [Methylococcales bacterium]
MSVLSDLNNVCPIDFSPFPWMEYAFEEIGTKEISGTRDNPRIKEYLASVHLGHAHDETPWCSAFANWCMKQADIRGTGKPNARSWLTWGQANACLATPCFGAVTILWRGQRNGWQGHVGFYVGSWQGKISLLGGNQGNKVSIAEFNPNRVLGYRWPASYQLPI